MCYKFIPYMSCNTEEVRAILGACLSGLGGFAGQPEASEVHSKGSSKTEGQGERSEAGPFEYLASDLDLGRASLKPEVGTQFWMYRLLDQF